MKVKVLMENTHARPDALTEHGLSLYIETKNHRLLFDMGQSDRFAQNARMLNVDLRTVDAAVLSHGHYDHGGGLARFMEENRVAPIYISRYAFEPHYSGTDRYIGLDVSLKNSPQFVTVADYLSIDEELELYSCNPLPRQYDTDSFDLNMLSDSGMTPDDFRHEQYLLIHDGTRRVLVSGCSHKGILNIMEWFQPDVLIGGFHFFKLDPTEDGKQALDQAALVLGDYSTSYYTCHCTGTKQYDYLKAQMGDKLHYLASGQVIDL